MESIVSQLNSDNWNLALPSIANLEGSVTSLEDSVLPIIVNNTVFGILLGQVHYVDYPEALTPLPLTSSPIEGLARFNELPLVQINVAQTLGLESSQMEGKIVVITLPQGNLALRVDEVLSFSAAKKLIQSAEIDQNLSLLKLDEIFPWVKNINDTTVAVTKPDIVPTETTSGSASGSYILLVTSSDHTIGLLANSIERIEQIDDSLCLRKFDTDADFLVRVEDYLLPARSLARLLNKHSTCERQALIIRGLNKPAVLTVERISSLEKVDFFHLTTSQSGIKSLWYLCEDKPVVEVVDAKEFFINKPTYHNDESLQLIDPQSRWDNLPQLSAKLSTEGVRIQCGQLAYVLPLALVNRILGDGIEVDRLTGLTDPTDEVDQLFEQQGKNGKIPVIDCVKLFNQSNHKPSSCHILLTFPCGHVVIAVHRAELQPTLPSQQWLPLTLLPPPAALLFDAATFDDVEEKWVLRVKERIDFAQFPWNLKRLVVASLITWMEADKLNITNAIT
jgi:chemotaxis signal transduction protein